MELLSFPEVNAEMAKDQPEYRTMPAHRGGDREGTLTCCWRLGLVERLRLLWTGRIWHQILTFHRTLQPQLLLLDKPTMVGGQVASTAVADRPGEGHQNPNDLIVGMILMLSADESSSVTVFAENPEGVPGDLENPCRVVEIVAPWTDWEVRRFAGDSVLKVLAAAVNAMRSGARG